MLSKGLEKALNDQIADENYASHYYLAMASWCEGKGLKGCAAFMYDQAEQERQHMMKLFHYVNDAGGSSVVQEVSAPPKTFKSIEEVFKSVLKHEQLITEKINKLVETCLKEGDYSSFSFLQWYVAEQHEEETLFNNILDIIKITGLEGTGLFMVDRQIGQMKTQHAH